MKKKWKEIKLTFSGKLTNKKKSWRQKYKINLQQDADNQGKGTELNCLTHKKTPPNKLMTMFNQAGLQQEAER